MEKDNPKTIIADRERKKSVLVGYENFTLFIIQKPEHNLARFERLFVYRSIDHCRLFLRLR